MRPHAPSGSATPAVSDRTGDYLVLPGWSPSSPDLYGCPGRREAPARPALSRETMGPRPLGVSDTLASVTCGDLCAPPPGQRRRPSATGRGGHSSYSFFQSCYRNPLGQHGEGSATVIMSHPWFLIFERLPGQRRGEPRALLTSRVARSLPTCHPEVEVCKVWFVSAATVRKRLSDLNACSAMPSCMFGSSTPKQPRLFQVKCCPTARAEITDRCGCRRSGAGSKGCGRH